MVTTRKNVFGCAVNFLRGKKCIFCGSFKTNRTSRGYVKCRSCKKQKSMNMIRREIGIVTGFYQQVPAYRLANDLGVDYQTVTRVYQNIRASLYHIAELEGTRMSGEVEMDEAYFGGRRKGKRGRGAAGKSIAKRILWAFRA